MLCKLVAAEQPAQSYKKLYQEWKDKIDFVQLFYIYGEQAEIDLMDKLVKIYKEGYTEMNIVELKRLMQTFQDLLRTKEQWLENISAQQL